MMEYGRGWTRTNEDFRQQIYSLRPLPLGNTPVTTVAGMGYDPMTSAL